MNKNPYHEIIKKQQEIINLMIETGIYAQQTGFAQKQQNEPLDNAVSAGIDKTFKDNNCTLKTGEKCDSVPVQKKHESDSDIEVFCKYLKSKGMSQNGIDSYKYTVNEFFSKYGLLNNDTLAQYEQYLKENRSPKTVNLRIAGMSKYLKYINYTDYEFTRSKEQKQTFCDNAINETQFNKLIDWAYNNNINVWLIAKVIGGTGVRVSELIELTTEDLIKGYADIIGKGNKQRRIYFPQKLIGEIKDKCGKVYIIENRYGLKITTRGVSQLLANAAEKAGIPKEVMHPHSFRHFFAKQFMKKTQDISLLGDLLGHSNISTTAIYTRLTSEEQQNEINKLINW